MEDGSTPFEVLEGIYTNINIIKKIFYYINYITLYNLIKIACHPVQGRVFQHIMENRAFTTYSITRSLLLTRNEVYPIIQKLENMGYIYKHSTFKNSRGPSTHVYLIVGDNTDIASKGRILHEKLKNKSKPLPLYHYTDSGLAVRIAEYALKEKSYMHHDMKLIDKKHIQKKIREELGHYDHDLFQDIRTIIRSKGGMVAI